MAIPLVAPAVAGLAKLGLGAKLSGALGAAKGLVGAGAAKQLAIPGLQVAAKNAGARMAGDAMFKSGLGKAVFGDMTKGQIGMRLAPDLMFGGVAGLMTPGDLGDKLIAGGAQAVGGGLGGVAVGRAAGRMGETAGFLGDMAGSFAGDFAGMAVGDNMMRGKDRLLGGKGQTPYEKLNEEQQSALVQQIRNQTLAGANLIPGINSQYLGLGTGFNA